MPAQKYSPLAHIGRTIWLGNFSPENMFVMLSAFYDDAGGADHGFTVVSGWVSTLERWERFDVDWRLILARYDLPYFSMKECSQFSGPFKKWKNCLGTRTNFLRDAAAIVKAYALHGFGNIVLHREFDAVNRLYTLKEHVGSPYALAGYMCVKQTHEWALKNDYEGWKIAYVFDQGTPKSGTLHTLMEREERGAPFFRSPRDVYVDGAVQQKALTPLQAADFLAYEIRKIKRDDPEELWPISRYRKSVRALVSVPAFWGQFMEGDLEALCRTHPKIKPRMQRAV
jgi:hypothetical protein